jgi:hypothetical protein
MTTQQKAVLGEEMSPHLRQRVAFIAALIVDPDNVNWSAISDTFDDLSQESQGAAFEKSVELLRKPILQKDARALGQTIGSLLSTGESPAQTDALAPNHSRA